MHYRKVEFIFRYKKKFHDVAYIKLDAISIKTNKIFYSIFSNKVLHHLSLEDLEKSLKRQQNVIAPNGVFAHRFWLGDKEFIMEGKLFIFHDRVKLINTIFKYFSVIALSYYNEFEQEDSIFIIAQNNKTV